jgi:uncharacterized membrane protein YdjX (TVP38/TMEM64 family)
MPLVFSSAFTVFAIRNEAMLHALGGSELALAFTASAFTMAFGLTPTTYVALLSGYFVGWVSLAGVVPAYMVAAMLGYGAATLIDRGALARLLSRYVKDEAATDRLRRGEIPFIILVRISPFLPFALMNILLAALRTRITPFLLASLLGMLPRTILFIWVGMQFSGVRALLEEGTGTTPAQVSVVVLSVVSVAGLYYLAKRYVVGVFKAGSGGL